MRHFILFIVMIISFVCGNAQNIGSKISFPGTDGRTYTGIIKETRGDQYKVKYDGYDFEAWLVKAQFSLVDEKTTANNTLQKTGNWVVGDKVEVYDMYTNKWENGTVSIVYTDRTPQQWRVNLDEPQGHAIADLPVTAKQVRARGSRPDFVINVNSRVDAYYADGTPRGRATVIEVKPNGRYKVKYDGCKDHFDEEVDWSQLKPASIISSTDPAIRDVLGKWAMFVYSYPNTTVRGNDIYREYGTGAKAPPLTINADGTFVWYDEFNKPPVKGKWVTHAKIAGLTMGTEAVDGIIIYDSRGNTWKIYKDRADHIEGRQMCTGLTQGGTKIK
jgi:hypothetical protein